MSEQVEEIEVQETPGAAPGISFGDLIKWAPVLQKVIQLLMSGEGEFDVKAGAIRKHIKITNLAT